MLKINLSEIMLKYIDVTLIFSFLIKIKFLLFNSSINLALPTVFDPWSLAFHTFLKLKSLVFNVWRWNNHFYLHHFIFYFVLKTAQTLSVSYLYTVVEWLKIGSSFIFTRLYLLESELWILSLICVHLKYCRKICNTSQNILFEYLM